MKSLRNGLVCLRLLAENQGVLSVAQVSSELKLPRSSAYRLLSAIASEGFFRRGEEPGTYVAGSQLVACGGAILSSYDVRDLALPDMRLLSDKITHSVYLMVRNGFEAVCIELVAGDDGLRLDVAIGSRRQLHCSGIAKAFLPSLSASELKAFVKEGLPRITARTLTSVKALKEHIDGIQKSGFAISTGEFVFGARSIGVPIYGHQGTMIAALGVGGSIERLSDTSVPAVVRAMQAAAASISSKLGYRGATVLPGNGIGKQKRAA